MVKFDFLTFAPMKERAESVWGTRASAPRHWLAKEEYLMAPLALQH